MRPKFTFTESHLPHLRAVKAMGGSLEDAAHEMGITRNTLATAIVDAGFTESVKEIFPRFGTEQPTKCKHSGMRVIGLADLKVEPVVVPGNVPARWLAKSWRAAA
ncbi:hypothetical protein [uncultured Marinobacter sp.]|uniref:hypothetical protein n=1 Tax=uncultured Marinobacter sp. TaxID=187379 RepID=UPI0030D85724